MLNAKSNKNFLSKNLPNLGLLGWMGSGGIIFFPFLLQKAHPCMNPRRLSHFASKSVEGCDLRVGWGKKSESHIEAPIGKTCRRNTGLELPFSL